MPTSITTQGTLSGTGNPLDLADEARALLRPHIARLRQKMQIIVSDLKEEAVLEKAAQALEIPWSTAKRVVREVVTGVHRAWPRAQHRLANVHSAALATQPTAAKHFAEQLRLVRLFEQAILGEMAPRLTGSAWPGRATLIRAPAGESW